jgi:hypothetical protein
VSVKRAEIFLQEKLEWIIETVRITREKHREKPIHQGTPAEYRTLKRQSLQYVTGRVSEINREFYGFAYNKVSVRNQKTRWGSCSKDGNLSFNYRIFLLPPHCADYLIAHELSHLKQFNHSDKFWDLVARACPDHRSVRREMRKL